MHRSTIEEGGQHVSDLTTTKRDTAQNAVIPTIRTCLAERVADRRRSLSPTLN
jgi:hypothetical protein